MRIRRYFREISDHARFFDDANAAARRIVFYSERDIYYQYYEGLIGELLRDESLTISYLTSDDADPLFRNHPERLKVFFVDKLLPATMAKLKADVLVMTMPDLNRFHVRKSPGTRNHVYMFHAMVSTHLQYRKGAFDDYDTIFCVGPHHVREIRRAEELYGLRPKTLVESGYYRLEKIHADHRAYASNATRSGRRTLLVAPTWGPSSVLEICPDALISALAGLDWRCVIRPHPEFLKRKPSEAARLRKLIAGQRNIEFETDMVSEASIHAADVLITDRSGIAFEYAFGTERPVILIDTPLKIQNSEYEVLGLIPFEVATRKDVGIQLGLDVIDTIGHHLRNHRSLIDSYRPRIVQLRDESVFSWMISVSREADFIKHAITTPKIRDQNAI